MKLRLALLLTIAAPLGAASALAQSDPTSMAHAMAANQLGVLEYCQNQGDVDQSAVTAERSVISHMPTSTSTNTTTDNAVEATGKTGRISANGNNMTLSNMASTHNTTVGALCKQLGNSAVQSAAMMKQNNLGAAGMPAMPALPSGTGIPTIPSMPTIPSTPPSQ